MIMEIVDKSVFEIMALPNNFVVNLVPESCVLLTVRILKYVFPTKIWFVKTSTRIMKYESQIKTSR